MSIAWSTAELEAINKQTLKELKPSYYYIKNKSYIQISEDFEGYLILQGSDDKQKILTWMKDVSKINNDTKDQNELLSRFLQVRSDDATARVEELDEKLNKYDDMQTDLITDGNDPSRYGSIVELSLMVTSITNSVDNILIQKEQAFHEQNMIATITDILTNEKVTDDTKKELTSWQNIMSTYKGQKNKPKSNVSKASTDSVF
jgi:hypothetical protein